MSEEQVVTVNASVPLNYSPRSYQRAFFQAMTRVKRAILVWHRRAGKDKTLLNFMILKMLERVGIYYYFTPTYTQGKKFLWDGIGRDGFKFMDHFPGFDDPSAPGSIVEQKWEDEMKVKLKNGSIFQIVGTDKLDSVRGTNPVGCGFSEYAMMNPTAWDIVRPILRENGGWAVFIYTPMGKNHGYRLWERVHASQRIKDQWFTSLLTIEDTRRDAPGEDGSWVTTVQDVEDDIAEGMDEALARQEYFCSWEGHLRGAYYGDLLTRLRSENRIGLFPHDPGRLVTTAWDVGVDDATAIVFTQTINGVPRIIDYFEAIKNAKNGLPWYVKYLRREKSDYDYDFHFGPHDMKVTEWGTGNTRVESAADLGFNFEIVPKLKLEDGIDATRKFLAKCVINAGPCERLLDVLNSYRREWDDEKMTWEKQPVHDWTSHGADATRQRAVAWFDPELSTLVRSHARMNFNVQGQPGDEAEVRLKPWERRWPEDGRWTSRTVQTHAET
jgi:phage terminase large subunit